jgi:hypothetical protein
MTKPGRNDPCPCGSGKKYKKCHGVAGPKKFTATILSTKSFSLANRISSAASHLTTSIHTPSSLKDRITSHGASSRINQAIENAKFHQEHVVEQEPRQEKEEKFLL